MRYERIPREVDVELLLEPWEWLGPNGDALRAVAGDYRVTDPVCGETWSITADALARGYDRLEGRRYLARGTVQARRAEADEQLTTAEGRERVRSGDWVVTDDGGARWVLSAASFASRYRATEG